MRILLTANASYVPPRGGATRSNLVWLEKLAEAGHECRVVCSDLADRAGRARQIEEEEIEKSWTLASEEPGVHVARRRCLTVFSATDRTRLVPLLRREIRAFAPDWVLVSSEDVGHVLLGQARELAPGRIVYLAHTPQFFPFGPESWNPGRAAAEAVERSAAIVVIGRNMAAYVRQHTGREATVIHPPIYGAGPYRNLGSFERGFVTIVNPCAVKGIDIFLGIAGRMPDVAFGALPGWGTTTADRAALERHANVTLLANCRDIEQMLARTRILLMPSLWYEGFGLIVVEAMLRGIPVIASGSGGLVDGKLGTGMVVPAPAIERYEAVFDERGMPKPVLPPLPIEPWVESVRTLISSRPAYERESAAARTAALAFVASLRAGAFEEFLRALAPPADGQTRTARSSVENLSPAKRALLMQRLRKQQSGER